ncbi:glutathione S-transferase N-terminal domain-containing protein [Teichococcus oryzae]|uniref:Maleylacetoacetate isomerase n=1 Tax=Teichococcus oryzae TaxID=1608942 RepID=A0A5B2TH21_9PROT|nr:glutathione S-transferase N-terminal domain-containing protein [Pseudoroseomonas oryzae]KAA2213218.1 maleylacetoacetate isomerase [Pseudoroseomonas oryzae]
MRLYGYSQSPATQRIQIALALKGLDAPATLSKMPCGMPGGGAVLQLGGSGALPALELADGVRLTQSLAILEWLEEIWPTPPLLPPDPLTRARVRGFAQTIASDVHPLQSLRLVSRSREGGLVEGEAQACARRGISEGLEICESLLVDNAGPFCFGETPGLADLCLVPQLRMARHFGVHLAFPHLLAAEAACLTLPAFRQPSLESVHAG